MQQYVDDGQAPGFVTMVARGGQIVHVHACGYRDADAKLALQRDSIFRIYSMTKPITSVALMMLYEEGKFQLGDPVSRYISAFAKTRVLSGYNALGQQLVPQQPAMTIQHLLTHTAGLSYGFHYDSPIDDMYRNSIFRSPSATLAEKITGMAALPLRFQPGSAWEYSIATDVCGYLVQLLADMPLETYLRERIFAPLGMDDTAFFVPPEKLPRFARLYQHRPVQLGYRGYAGTAHIPRHDFTQPPVAPSGGGGLVSTVDDYWQFAAMLLHGGAWRGSRLLGRKTLSFMCRNHLRPELLPLAIGLISLPGAGFGLGFSVLLDAAQTGVLNSDGSYGWSGAAATNFWVDPQEQLVGIIMTQLMDNLLPLEEDFRALVYQALVD